METAIIVAVIGAVATMITGVLLARLTKQDKAIEEIHVEVNQRLTTALDQIDHLNQLINTSRVTGDAVPPHYGRRATDLQGDEGSNV